MSVAEPLRHKGRLEVHVKAQALATYTSQILKNTNIFNPEVDKYLIKRIKKHAIKIYENAWAANKIRADTASKGDGWKMLKNMDRYYQQLWEEGTAYENSQATGAIGGTGTDESNEI